MREDGCICLLELGFLTNKNDIAAYIKNREALAKRHAEIIVKYEKMA